MVSGRVVHTSRTRSHTPSPVAGLVLGLLLGVLVAWPVGAFAQGQRTLEMVSPVEKNNASIVNGMMIDSDHAIVTATASILESDPFLPGAGEYIGARSPAGWALEFSPLTYSTSLVGFPAWNDRIFESFFPVLPGEVDDLAKDVYRWRAGTLSPVSTGALGGQGQFDAGYLTNAAAGEHILFRTSEVLDANDTGRDPFTTMLYERIGDQTRAVGLDSDEQPISPDGAILAGAGEGAFGSVGEGGTTNPISADGSRIFFEAPDPARGGNTQLYVRENGQTTTLVSPSQRTTPGSGPLPVRFEGASADGSRVLFRTAAQLVDDDDDQYIDLYAYDLATQGLTRLSAGQQGPLGGRCQADKIDGPPGVCGVIAVSEDAQRVYYISTGALTPDAVAGYNNVYLYDGHSGETQSVLSTPSDLDDVVNLVDEEVRVLYQAGFDRAKSRAEATADGSVLVFGANSPLTGFDTSSPACPSTRANRCTADLSLRRRDRPPHVSLLQPGRHAAARAGRHPGQRADPGSRTPLPLAGRLGSGVRDPRSAGARRRQRPRRRLRMARRRDLDRQCGEQPAWGQARGDRPRRQRLVLLDGRLPAAPGHRHPDRPL